MKLILLLILVLLLGCLQHPQNRPENQGKFITTKQFCENNHGKYSYSFYGDEYCAIKQNNNIYKQYEIEGYKHGAMCLPPESCYFVEKVVP